jgi:type 2A phosphatase activator TIP41
MKALPEMVFGNNYVKISHKTAPLQLTLNAFDALSTVDKSASNLPKVSFSKDWMSR